MFYNSITNQRVMNYDFRGKRSKNKQYSRKTTLKSHGSHGTQHCYTLCTFFFNFDNILYTYNLNNSNFISLNFILLFFSHIFYVSAHEILYSIENNTFL